MRFKGTIGTGGDITTLPTTEVKVGDTWQIAFPDIEGNKITIKVEDACGVRYAPELRYLADQRDLSDLTMAKANLVSGTGNIAVPFCVEFDNG